MPMFSTGFTPMSNMFDGDVSYQLLLVPCCFILTTRCLPCQPHRSTQTFGLFPPDSPGPRTAQAQQLTPIP